MKGLFVLLSGTLLAQGALVAQVPRGEDTPERQARREAVRLDGEGKGPEARVIWRRTIEEAPDYAATAAAYRRMAMSYGFSGDCTNATRYHDLVIAYWVTREAAEPQNAFYQQGEMANESARVCVDAGDLDKGEAMYRRGWELGNREPEPRTHPKSLWDYRLAHALGRIAARRGDKAEAERQVAEARRILDADPAMAEDQERYFPYLAGYVALYTGDLSKAEQLLGEAVGMNQRDAFMNTLLAQTYEQMGQTPKARELYEKAYQLAEGGHNPPAAYARRVAGEKLGH